MSEFTITRNIAFTLASATDAPAVKEYGDKVARFLDASGAVSVTVPTFGPEADEVARQAQTYWTSRNRPCRQDPETGNWIPA